CDGVIVSNHGGRQLDAVPAACAALPGVVNAIGGQAQIILDGGVRRGTDILKALALGASACMIGRPFLWGLASAGPAGVARTLKIFRDELDNGLALLGVRSLKDISGTTFGGKTPSAPRWKVGLEHEGFRSKPSRPSFFMLRTRFRLYKDSASSDRALAGSANARRSASSAADEWGLAQRSLFPL
ncbi:MAG: alpha-hydroxy-acid oxidizing protein, partial [Acetobacteraceae bacterium]|nr:alpha-hydroxy-acid oxidizing protein [Acetobacteraceae bacterium]